MAMLTRVGAVHGLEPLVEYFFEYVNQNWENINNRNCFSHNQRGKARDRRAQKMGVDLHDTILNSTILLILIFI